MQCAQCLKENKSGRKFCAVCGHALPVACPQCGFVNDPDDRFCGGCGQALAPHTPASANQPVRHPNVYTPQHLADKILTSRSALEGERKQVTVLFADTAGFTALARRLDPEVVHEIMDYCFELITDEVHRFEGTINQYTGDGIMALFGAPIAHEDSPRRAVHAALGIQRAIQNYGRELQAQRNFSLQMRIGINTGLVVVGKIGDDLRMDYTAVGDTTNLAARLQQLAEPGTVVISEATHRLVRGFFETQDLGECHVKGHVETVRVFEVGQSRGRRTRLDVEVERGLTPLVGRDRELATLMHLFQQIKAGQGQVVFIAGEAGVGKSRLFLEFRRVLADTGETATWLEGRCQSFGQTIPFLPVVDQLRINFGIEEVDDESAIIAKVEGGMRRLGELEAYIPAVRYLLAVDPGDEEFVAMEPAERRKRLFDAVLALSLRGAQLRPLVLVYEDLHWIDTGTEALLSALIDAVVGVPLLLLLTYRPDYSPSFGSRSFFTTMSLRRLSERDTLTMISQVFGTQNVPEELKTMLLAKAEGVPLFVEEVIKALLDVGMIRQENGAYRMVQEISEVNVPDTIQGIVMARLDRLGEEGKRTVQLASVIGRQFFVRLLERIADVTRQLDELLGELQGLEIIYRQGMLPEPCYAFKHAVIQDVAYNSLLLRQRKVLHQALGVAIEDLYPDRLAEHYEELAHHFTHGAVWSKAMEYSILAGDRAVNTFANVEAKTHYTRALQAAAHMEPLADPGVVARLYAKHAMVLELLGEYDEAVAAYQLALELTQRIGDQRGEVDILVGLSGVYNTAHREEPATVYSEQALTLARDLNDRACLAACLVQHAAIRSVAYGQIVEATPDAEEALHLAREIGEPKSLAQTLLFLGGLFQWRAAFDQALAYCHEGVELSEGVHAGLIAHAAFFIGHARAARGEYEEALRWYRRLDDYASAARNSFWIARVPNTIGGIHLELYDLDEALRLNLEGDDLAQQHYPWPEPRGHCLVKAGLVYLHQGNHARAHACLRHAEALLEEDAWMRWRWHMVLLRALGELAWAEERHEDAWSYATESLDLARRSDSRKHVVRAQWLQGQVLAASGRLEEAVRTLAASIRLAKHIGTPREMWLSQAALGKVLAQLGREQEAEAQFVQATQVIEGIAANLLTPRLRSSFLGAVPVQEVYDALGRRPPRGIL